MLCALIMAGGKGTRFWPLSTEEKPKQFLSLINEKTMLQMTVDRILPIIPIERIFVCTGERYVDLVKEQLVNISSRNIIVEPEGRNTAPCITLSAMIINRYYKDSTMLVLPADHLIKDEEGLRYSIIKCEKVLKENRNSIITFGIKPNRVETGYGYIKYNNNTDSDLCKVDRFVEKPNRELAEEYFKSNKYLWNSGIFMWNTSHIINQIKIHKKEMYKALEEVEKVREEDLQEVINSKYKYAENISIDYAILEKAEEIYVIPSDIGWDDVGSWNAIERYSIKDDNGNIHMGDVQINYSKNNLVVAAQQKILIDEVSNIYVVENNGKIIIGKKENLDKLKELKKLIEVGV